jgi:hypothetical protein
VSDPRQVLGLALTEAVEALVAERIAEAVADLERDGERWPAYMDVPTAARYLGVAEERVRKLIARRAVAVVQEAPRHRVTLARDDLDALMRTWRVEG